MSSRTEVVGLTRWDEAACREARRLAAVVEEIVAAAEPVAEPRRRAVLGAVDRVCLDVREHHLAQETWLWPQLDRWAPGAADLDGLAEDHTALFACADSVRRSGGRGVPASVGPVDGRRSRRLVSGLRELADLLEEHTAVEEREIAPHLAVLGGRRA